MTSTQLTGSGPNVVAQGLLSESSVQLHNLGELVHANDGRAFRYVKAGGTALVAGKLQQASAEDTTNYQNLAVSAAAVGDTSITVTSSVTVTANILAGGFAAITVTPGVGYTYAISGNTAASASGFTINLKDSIAVALTTSSKVDVIPNPYASVVVNPATLTSTPVGVAVYPVTAAYFGWLCVAGPAAILADGANAVGAAVVASNAVAGAVEDAAGPGAQGPQVGSCITGAADTEYGLVKVSLL